uniref:SGNH hydrolase-type esterase domain-containing protein n=1 Tax=Amblyomma maculatum TaxID=34609 RepID=G3MRC6_AMBMU
MSGFLRLIAVCLVLGVAQGYDNATYPEKIVWPQIYLFGDSLTQYSFSPDGYWGSIVADAFSRKCDVVVRGYGGYNTRMCKHVLRRVLSPDDAKHVAAFVIMLGSNDGLEPEHRGRTHVPLLEYEANLEEMVDYLKSSGVPEKKVIFVTPPPVDEGRWAHLRGPTGGPTVVFKSIEKYANACVKLGKRRGIAVVDAFHGLQQNGNWKRFLSDGVHFSRAGSERFSQLLLPTLKKVVGPVPRIFKDYRDLDRNNVGKSINEWKPSN